MIPPSNTLEDADTIEKKQHEQLEQPQSPTSAVSQQESKLQKLKRSLSFKTKSLRSKSAENFFQRTNSDMKLQVDLLSKVSTSTGQLSTLGSLISSPSKSPNQVDFRAHSFIEHIFKKPTFCDVCNHMIVGTNTKHGLRCKACKMTIHHKCANSVGQQHCVGKLQSYQYPLDKALDHSVLYDKPLLICRRDFKRYYSSPLLIQEQFGCIKEVMPIACGSRVDPVYETLRFGTSLAQKSRRTGSTGSGSESPHRNSSSDLAEVPEEADAHGSLAGPTRKRCDSDSVFTSLENGTEHFHTEEKKQGNSLAKRQHKDLLQLNTYVALFKFIPQENEDLEMRPGDRIILLDDSNEDWWKGTIEDRVGFFPANFADQVKTGEKVYRCTRTFIGCKEQGQIILKEGQICVANKQENNGFIKVSSGKKKGFVPFDVLENI